MVEFDIWEIVHSLDSLESQKSYEVQTRSQQAGRNKEMERYPQNLSRIQRQT